MFDKLLADYTDQLALFDEGSFGQISEIEEDAFEELDGFGLASDSAQGGVEIHKTDLDEYCFVALDEGAFVELGKS